MIHLRTTSKYKHTQRILTTKVSNMDQSLISCYCEGNKMVAGFNPPAATARIPPLAFRQDRTSAAAVSTAPVGWCGCTALSCWASASAWGNICCTSWRRRPAGFLLEQKGALHCLQKHFYLSVQHDTLMYTDYLRPRWFFACYVQTQEENWGIRKF